MSTQEDPKISNENVAKKGIKNIDAVVTGVILWGIIASLYGVKKLREKEKVQEVTEHTEDHMIEPPKKIERISLWKRIFRKR